MSSWIECRSSVGRLLLICEVATMLCTVGSGMSPASEYDGSSRVQYLRLRIGGDPACPAQASPNWRKKNSNQCPPSISRAAPAHARMILTGSWRDHCSLCGIRFDRGLKRRFQSASAIRAFVRDCCKPSPFAHAIVLAGTGTEMRGLCIPCVNWKRRVEGSGLRRTSQPMLQYDQLVLYAMRPGLHHEPDHRCMERLVTALRQTDNPFRAGLPLPVQAIASRVTGDTFTHVVAAWWDYNGRTHFFRTAHEARRVRCAAKQGLLDI